MCVGIFQLHEQTNKECISPKYLSPILSLSPSFLHICFLHSVKPPPRRCSETVLPQWSNPFTSFFLSAFLSSFVFLSFLRIKVGEGIVVISFSLPSFLLLSDSENVHVKKNVSRLSVNSTCRLLIVSALFFHFGTYLGFLLVCYRHFL